ncbi:DUF86 domain-containing protein [bacterium]
MSKKIDLERIQNAVKDKNYNDFSKNNMLQAAVERKFEIIGEALNKIKYIDQEFIESITDYRKIIGFRNVIAHGYDVIDTKIIWDATQFNLPNLHKDIIKILDKHNS